MKFCPVCGTEYAEDVKFCPRDGQTLRSLDPTADLVGQVLADRYHIQRKLGEGGMGAVYLAEHVKMGRLCAIKVMGSGLTADPEAIARFNREAANACRINHPNVCAVYDFGETGEGMIYLAMEYIEGQTLSQLLRETGPMPLPRAADLLRQAADALQAAHELGIVHRDLKPDNIMVVTRGGRDVVKVVDFGIAKATGTDTVQKVTRTGLVVGTPEYMSPEQLSGDPLDGRSDIYSLAIVFYRMVTGTLPFIAETAQETMIKRLTDEPMPLEQARPGTDFPAGLQPALTRALARYPHERYPSAPAFAAAVTQAVGRAPAGDAATQMVRQSGLTQLTETPVPATRVAPRPRTRSWVPVAAGVGIVAAALGGGWLVMRGGNGGGEEHLAATDTTSQAAGPRGNDSVVPLSHPGTTPPDTAARNPDTSRTRPEPAHPATSGGPARQPAGDPGHPSPDPAAANRIIFALQDTMIDDPSRTGELSRQLESLYRETALPDTIRARAAFSLYSATVGTAPQTALRWVREATRLAPANSIYRRAQQDFEATLH